MSRQLCTAPRRVGIFVTLLSFVSCDRNPTSDIVAETEARCTECDIELERVATISDSADPGALPDFMVYASQDRAGRIFVISRKQDRILVFDSTGHLMHRLGKAGSGPGEFGVVRRVLHGPGDSTFVSDWGLGRVTVYAPDLTLARTEPIVNQPDLVLDDGSFVVAAQVRTKDLIGYPIHRALGNGNIVRSFGADTPQYRPDLDLITTRRAALSGGGKVWSIAPGRYVLEQWDPNSGQRTKAVRVNSTWFKEIAAWPDDETKRPPAVILTLWEDRSGIVWVLLRDADLDWRPPERANVERRIGTEEYEMMYDWVLEAVDPASGAIIASKRFRKALWARPGSAVLVSANTVTSTQSTYDVWKPQLTQREGAK